MSNTVVNLSALNPASGYYIGGWASGDQGGLVVSGAGDINGDGTDDFLIGSAVAGEGGAVYVLYGGAPDDGSIELSNLTSSQGFRIEAAMTNDRAGSSISAAGDVNGDGIGDLVIGAEFGDSGGSFSGQAYLLLGVFGERPGDVLLSDTSTYDGMQIQGVDTFDNLGSSVSSAGDVNGDGIDDVILGASKSDLGGTNAGAAYVIYGAKSLVIESLDLSALTPNQGFAIIGSNDGDGAGTSVAAAGDINGDGFDDILVSAPTNDSTGTDAGTAYVIYGSDSDQQQGIDLGNLAATDGFTIFGPSVGAIAGKSLSSAGDINGDGFEDLLIGAPYQTAPGAYSGAAYLIYGGRSGDLNLSELTEGDGFIISGAEDFAGVGYSVAMVGDVNGDGFGDFAVGAPYSSQGSNYSGTTYIIFGCSGSTREAIDLQNLQPEDGYSIVGANEEDLSGTSVASAGDVNGDGVNDILVGAPYLDSAGDKSGGAYVIFGLRPEESVTRYGTQLGQRILGGTFGDSIFGLSGDDTLDGGGGSDLLDGGDGFDLADYSSSGQSVALSLLTGIGESGDASGDVLVDIESVWGSAFDDDLEGSEGRNVVNGNEGNDRLFGRGKADSICGGAGSDLVRGGGGADNLDGGEGADRLFGGGGDDVFEFSLGSDLLNGGDGFDTATFSESQESYSVTHVDQTNWRVRDLSSGEEYILTDIERVAFIDSSLVLM